MSRDQSRSEEWANGISHLIGVIIGILSVVYFQMNDYGIGSLIFGGSIILLYSISSIYHFLSIGDLKHKFRILDHSAIFILIAGTYTPFLIEILGGTWEVVLLSFVWLFAICGVLFKVFGGVDKRKISIFLYILMGWIFLMVAKPLWAGLYPHSIFWLLGGGVFYTVGILFYVWERLKFNHLVWHIFVLAGSICHLIGVYRFENY